jgi:hypothetical protein
MAESDPVTDQVKYLVTDDRGEFVIELPVGWKITFGYVNPGLREQGGYGGKQGHCLRIYKGKELRAVLGNVTAVRDLSIPFMRKVERQTGSAEWTKDSIGNFARTEKVNVESELILEPGDGPF